MEINKTAKLFGLFKFDAFNQKHIKGVRRVLNLLIYVLILIALFLLYFIGTMDLDQFFFNKGFSGGVTFVLLVLGLIFSMLYLTSLLCDNDSKLLHPALSQVSADHLLSEFKFNPHNENSEQSEIRSIAKEDIERNGYFSAAGYLRIKELQIEFKKLQERNSGVELKKRNIEEKYPDVFKRSRE